VKTYQIVFRERAKADLFDLYRYVSEESGHEVAGRYIDRIEAACMALARFPKRGRARHDLRPGLRILGFERRAIIAFVVTERQVVIARILYGGRDFETLLSMMVDDDES
jgi:toxin ParE1/3/4